MFYLYRKIILKVMIVFLLCFLFIQPIFAYEVILGGQSIGIELNYEGVLIKGMYDIEDGSKSINQRNFGFKENDIIIKVNDYEIDTIFDLSERIENCIKKQEDIILTLKRDNHYLKKKLTVITNGSNFSTGLYVKDGIGGIGTMTYYDENNKTFGALGHIMCDQSEIICNQGNIYLSKITKIIPSKDYSPGEKLGIKDSEYIGSIKQNNLTGIYGIYNQLPDHYQKIETAKIDELKKGKAYFLTVLDGNIPMKCHIEIISISNKKDKTKNFTFKIIDKEVLEKTKGIVQGMSGSPIVQNGKLVGAVTHVLVNDPTKGYGIFIENMIESND